MSCRDEAHVIVAAPITAPKPLKLGDRAGRMVQEAIAESGERCGPATRVAQQLGIGTESLRN